MSNNLPPMRPDARIVASAEKASDDNRRRLLLKAAACLLGYPDDALGALLDEIQPDLERLLDADTPGQAAGQAADDLVAAITALRAIPLVTLAETYVATFDFSEARALYLTAHELGDSRQRGQALLELRALVRAAGFEPPAGELPDHLPALLEFVSHAPPTIDTKALEHRLAAVCAQIRADLAADDPYRRVFPALCALLPSAELKETPETGTANQTTEQRCPLHQRADTAELPYPLRYE